MIEVAGKTVYTTLGELVDPRHTALLVVDMQRDFCLPGGSFAEKGIDISMYAPMIPRLRTLLEGARRAGVTVIFIQMTVLPGRMSESPAQIRFNMRLHMKNHGEVEPLTYTVEGTPGQEFIPELAPFPGAIVVRKYRSSGFWGTNLDLILRSQGIESVIVTGCTTEGCVESTARDAQFTDHYVIVPEDCVASDDRAQHDASLLLMRNRFDVTTSQAILAQWAKATTEA